MGAQSQSVMQLEYQNCVLSLKEMQDINSKSIWPLNHKKLNRYCKLIDKKFGFEFNKLNHNLVEKNLDVRKF